MATKLSPLILLAAVNVLTACTTTRTDSSSLSHYQALDANGQIVTVDSRTGLIVKDPRAAAKKEREETRRLAREKREKERQARRAGHTSSETASAPAEPEYWWRGDGVPGRPSISIRLGEQKAYFLKGGTVVGMAPISSGREGYRTPAGSFSITQKSRNHVSNLYGDYVDASGNVVVANVGVQRDRRPPGTKFRGAPMPYFMRIVGAVGMHAGYLPGYPASHGCIRLPKEMARIYFENVSHGTPVAVRY